MSTTETHVHQQIGALYSEHHGWLVGWLGHRLHCKTLGADLAQDTFTRILGAGRPLDLREPRAYLTTIAKGLVSTYLQRKKLEQAYLDALMLMPEDSYPSPEERMLVLEVLTLIDSVLDGLPSKVKQTFLLSQLDGLGYAEIGVQLGISLSTVKRHMVLAFRHCLTAASNE
ncbi:sigma-70 family RNA polymerase sigma factor [Herminiimonas fonticola]|uniref:sigma-70 family RNA polymerase sigma factor n=1 Tax=Herminiimonas fonticola TaxID=303380 RepID=UPI00334195E1